ncbi:hypothetical protein DL98DRAFT_156942 [Cadophora sp. DSE1049]|nr:hypothetical protein DL98DRAFT_156942 [Cadophora sp. DSE1049]
MFLLFSVPVSSIIFDLGFPAQPAACSPSYPVIQPPSRASSVHHVMRSIVSIILILSQFCNVLAYIVSFTSHGRKVPSLSNNCQAGRQAFSPA